MICRLGRASRVLGFVAGCRVPRVSRGRTRCAAPSARGRHALAWRRACSRHTFLTSTLRPECCCFRTLDPTQAVDPIQDVLTLAAEDMASGHLRVFLLRRLRLPPPVMPRDGRCHGRLDPLDGVRPSATGGTSAITASSKVSSALEPSAPCRPFAAWQQRVDHVIGEASCL